MGSLRMSSPALAKFSDRILEVKRLLALCSPEDADIRVKRENADRDNALLRGAHVLLCSHLEGFIEDLVADVIEIYDKLTDSIGQIPDELLARQVMGAEAKWEAKDPTRRWAQIKSCHAHPLMRTDGVKASGCMEPGLHTDGFANPGSNEVEALFKTVGLHEIWARFEAVEADKIYMQSLNIIVHRRNQIAHGKYEASITLFDAKTYVVRAERIAQVLDLVVANEVESRLGIIQCWRALEKAATAVVLAGALDVDTSAALGVEG